MEGRRRADGELGQDRAVSYREPQRMTAEEYRANASPEDIRAIVAAFQAGRCPCCGDRDPDEELVELEPCGHPLCEDCLDRSHDCLPCVLAV